MKCHEILTVINKINISSLGGLQSIVKRCADAVLSFDKFFSTKTSEVAHCERATQCNYVLRN